MKNFIKLLLAGLITAPVVNAQIFDYSMEEKIFSPRTTFPLTASNKVDGVPKNTIYITIDDGPTGQATPEVLKVLKKYNALATFFVIGKNVASLPNIVRQAYNDGHVIANHTYNHELNFPNATSLNNSLMRTHNVLIPYQDNAKIQLFRAPGGVWNNWRATVGNSHSVLKSYVGPIYWNVGGGSANRKDDADWKCWKNGVSVSACAKSYIEQINSNYKRGTGSIVLLHDINVKSAALLETILSNLTKSSIDWDFRLLEDIPAIQDLDR